MYLENSHELVHICFQIDIIIYPNLIAEQKCKFQMTTDQAFRKTPLRGYFLRLPDIYDWPYTKMYTHAVGISLVMSA